MAADVLSAAGIAVTIIERMAARPNALLERFHRRRGYATGYRLDTAWAISVDLAIAAKAHRRKRYLRHADA